MTSPLCYRYNLKKDSLEEINLPCSDLNLDEATRLIPGSAYTTFRTVERTKVLRLSSHLLRLIETSQLMGETPQLSITNIQKNLREALSQCHFESETRVRIILSDNLTDVYYVLEPFSPPDSSFYSQGVDLETHLTQRKNPKAKVTTFIETASHIRVGHPGAYEVLMISPNGEMLEGLTSNFFAVMRGDIYTASDEVLSGMTRAEVLKIARQIGLVVVKHSLNLKQLTQLDEAFITSSSRGIMPVRLMDGLRIGNRMPGEVTSQLLIAYDQMVKVDLEEI